MVSEPEVGATASAELVVGASDLASAVRLSPEDVFPPVLATARLVALMEMAAARLLTAHLGPGELSVGVWLDVTHSAATPEGVPVRATARFLGRDGKLFRFEVTASDQGGEIGRATHQRAVVSTERLLAGAERRNGRAQAL